MKNRLTTQTECGLAVITHNQLVKIDHGYVGLGIMLSRDEKLDCWCLYYQQGGDWSCFVDGDELNPEVILGWETEAIREACKLAREICNCEEDMEWFENWADMAEKTISE